MARIEVKICGIKTSDALSAAVQGGARYVGLNFHPQSPRVVAIEAAASLRAQVSADVQVVAVVGDADDALIGRIDAEVAPDFFQLHGSESLKRVAEVKAMTGKPVIKARPLATAEDVIAALPYEEVADCFLFDAKPAAGGLPGGSGQSFDWKLLSGRTFRRPWFLAGGLTAENVKDAVALSGASRVDVSSGVERARGEKDPALIRAFLDRVRAL
jgi:phosphoribosylanthranilate isomerase